MQISKESIEISTAIVTFLGVAEYNTLTFSEQAKKNSSRKRNMNGIEYEDRKSICQ